MENSGQYQFRNVLIVEDDLGQQPLWQHILSRSSKDVSITWAVSAEQALTILQESAIYEIKFDLIIVDLFLAGSETGLSFLTTDEVKQSKAQTILVSASSKDDLDGYIQKQLQKKKNNQIINGVINVINVIAKPLNVVKCEKVLDELLIKRQLYETRSHQKTK